MTLIYLGGGANLLSAGVKMGLGFASANAIITEAENLPQVRGLVSDIGFGSSLEYKATLPNGQTITGPQSYVQSQIDAYNASNPNNQFNGEPQYVGQNPLNPTSLLESYNLGQDIGAGVELGASALGAVGVPSWLASKAILSPTFAALNYFESGGNPYATALGFGLPFVGDIAGSVARGGFDFAKGFGNAVVEDIGEKTSGTLVPLKFYSAAAEASLDKGLGNFSDFIRTSFGQLPRLENVEQNEGFPLTENDVLKSLQQSYIEENRLANLAEMNKWASYSDLFSQNPKFTGVAGGGTELPASELESGGAKDFASLFKENAGYTEDEGNQFSLPKSNFKWEWKTFEEPTTSEGENVGGGEEKYVTKQIAEQKAVEEEAQAEADSQEQEQSPETEQVQEQQQSPVLRFKQRSLTEPVYSYWTLSKEQQAMAPVFLQGSTLEFLPVQVQNQIVNTKQREELLQKVGLVLLQQYQLKTEQGVLQVPGQDVLQDILQTPATTVNQVPLQVPQQTPQQTQTLSEMLGWPTWQQSEESLKPPLPLDFPFPGPNPSVRPFRKRHPINYGSTVVSHGIKTDPFFSELAAPASSPSAPISNTLSNLKPFPSSVNKYSTVDVVESSAPEPMPTW